MLAEGVPVKTTIDNNALSMVLKDNRTLGYAEYGDSKGEPIFYFHGFPSSRLEPCHLQNIALSNHYRLIGIDRPGMGISSNHTKHSILSWADDIEMFADYLGIKKFAIMGISGGAPFAAACAYKIPHRINRIVIVSGIAPMELPEITASLGSGRRFGNKLVQAMPWLATGMLKCMAMMLKQPGMVKYALKKMPEVDRFAIRSLGSIANIGTVLLEAFKQGVAGASQELQLCLKPWGFDILNIKCPTTIWQGGLDNQVPAMHAKLYEKLIPGSKLIVFKQEGHVSILINHGEEILRSACEA